VFTGNWAVSQGKTPYKPMYLVCLLVVKFLARAS
jgi:hypothetical protein